MVRLKGQDRMKGDERILGDGDFVMNILSDADERLDRRYELKSLGYDLDKVEQKVLEIYQIVKDRGRILNINYSVKTDNN